MTCPLRNSLFLLILLLSGSSAARAADPENGLRLLLEKPFLPADFSEEDFSGVWQVWPEPLRSEAEQATPLERRKMTFARYGLTARPEVDLETTEDAHFKPLQYVVGGDGRWTMNCFACHGGQVLGVSFPGRPNADFQLQNLSEDLRSLKLRRDPNAVLSRMERATQFVPLGTSRGVTNAVMFGVVLMSYRDPDLNLIEGPLSPRLLNHDMDAPPWWNFKHKKFLYADAYAAHSPRSLMQFMLVRSNGPEKFREWEADFEEIYAYLNSIEAPKYPFEIDQKLANRGAGLFAKNCAECHGMKTETGLDFPARVVAVKEVGTDSARSRAISTEDREIYRKSWFTKYGELDSIREPEGYLAQPLTGIWASAPYFHNGSVPTLWHVLHPKERPVVWTRSSLTGYDQQRVGFEVQELKRIPAGLKDPRERREFYDSRQIGKSNAGHSYPDVLSEDEKRAVLEYLKTL
ncbi:cytochrome c [Planctomicrobium sp. SH668]|uniref:c-type cytochrome n=1 Tax=Planctomicrobium sp. SH668 TaxID=3448126 RepID=UPI003F5AF0F1